MLLKRTSSNFHAADGEYPGLIKSAHLTERQSQYHANGVRQVLEIKVEVTREEDDPVTLLHSVNYTWSEKGKLVGLLEKLGKLPEVDEFLDLMDLVGLPVVVKVENAINDGKRFSNIVDMWMAQAQNCGDEPKSNVYWGEDSDWDEGWEDDYDGFGLDE